MEKKTKSFERRPVPDSEIEKIRQILFWQFQYVRRNFLKNYDESWIDILLGVRQWEDKELKSDTIRYVSNAILNKRRYGNCSYDLTQVPKSILENYTDFLNLSMECGYYLYDIFTPCPPLELIEFIHKYKTTPLPPVPYPGNDRNSSQYTAMHKLTHYLHGTSYHPVSKKDDSDLNRIATEQFYENVETELKESYRSDDKMDTATAKVFNENWKNFLSGKVLNNSKEVEPFIKVFKKYNISLYRVTSMETRAVGLFLWDYVNIHEFDLKDAIALLRKNCIYSESIGVKTDQDFERFLNGTNQCIKEKAVLKLSKK
jgi:hypothetical protein